MFANANNIKCPSFVERHADIGSIPDTIDAFYQASWGSNAFYAFPPVDDAPRALSGTCPLTNLGQGGANITVMGEVACPVSLFYSLMVNISSRRSGVGLSYQIRISLEDHMAMPATFLSPTRGGHKTPFIAVLINTAHDAPAELSDLPGRLFCLSAYYGRPSDCNLCSH